MGWEDIDHAVDRLSGRVGVKGGKDQVTSLGNGNSRLDSFEVAHLTNQYHIWVFAKYGAQRCCKRKSIIMNFTLSDNGALRAVGKLDWVFDSDNVSGFFAIDFVNEGGKCSRLTGTGWASNKYESARKIGKSLDDGWHAKIIDVFDLIGDKAESGGEFALFMKSVNAETRNVAKSKRKSAPDYL